MAATADDPRHVFLSAGDVLKRYGWGKTRGYQNLKDREMIPPPVVRHPNRWRLDQLMAWEERRMRLAEAALNAVGAGTRSNVSDLLPPAEAATSAGVRRHRRGTQGRWE